MTEDELTEILIDYWFKGLVSPQSVYMSDYNEVVILWHSA